MWLNLLVDAVPFFTAGGGGALAWYIRGAMGKLHDPKPTPKQQSLVDAVKAGYAAVDKMAKDIHAMYHPTGCKCAMCEIRGDDKDPEPPAGERCANPCFGCSILTCKKHPDLKPAGKANFTVMVDDKPVPARVTIERGDGPDPIRGKLRTDVRNLEAQLKSLAEAYQDMMAQRDSLVTNRGLVSAGMHVGGKPLYMLSGDTPKAEYKPASGPGSRHPFVPDHPFIPDPKATDRQNMAALAAYCRENGYTAENADAVAARAYYPRMTEQVGQRLARWERLEAEERANPGGTVIEEFGEGPVRYVSPRGDVIQYGPVQRAR